MMTPVKRKHILIASRMLLMAVYLFLFIIQGFSIPVISSTAADPSSLTYGEEHLPVYIKSAPDKLFIRADKRDNSISNAEPWHGIFLPDPFYTVMQRRFYLPGQGADAADLILPFLRGPPLIINN